MKTVVNVGVNALAREVGLAANTVSKKMSAGMTAEQIRQERAQKMPFAGTKAAKKPKVPSKSEYDLLVKGREQLNALDEMKFRRAKALAERQEIDNMLKRGELMPVAYFRQWASRYLIDGRDELLKGPSELADTLAAETDPVKVAAIVRAWLERVMAKWQQLERLWGTGEEERVA